MKITERVFDAITGETTDTERDMTPQEIAEFEKAQQRASQESAKQAEAESKKAAALAKLEALGLDEDDLKALGL